MLLSIFVPIFVWVRGISLGQSHLLDLNIKKTIKLKVVNSDKISFLVRTSWKSRGVNVFNPTALRTVKTP